MEVASRPRFTAGVALVGVGIVVASTVSPVSDLHLSDIHAPALRTAEIDLAAAVNPLEVYAKVIGNALAGASTLATGPKPDLIIKQVIANQLSNVTTAGADLANVLTTQVPQLVQTAVTQFGAGNVEGATNTLLQVPLAVALPVLPTLIGNPLQNVANVITAFTSDTLSTQLILGGLVAPLISTPAAVATAIQNVVDALGTGNQAAVLGAVLTAPATIADGLLNGGYGPDLGPLTGEQGIIVKAGGFFSPSTITSGPDGIVVNTGGPMAAMQAIIKKIVAAITPHTATKAAVKSATSDVASLPAAGATTVTLKTGSTASIPAKTPASAASTKAAVKSATIKDTPTQKPVSSTTSASTPASSSDTAGSSSTTKDATSKDDPTDAATDVKKSTETTTGNKTKAGHTTGSEGAKSGAASSKGAGKGAHTAKHRRHAK